jgi:hypothetical protein
MSETTLEQLLIANDLAKLSIDQRVQYYNDVCKSLGLNPLTRPFDFITLNGKLQLYAKKDATDQLRRIYQVSVNELTHDHKESLGLYIVTASGVNGQGRGDSSTGAVSIKGLAGDNLANAIMKAETKAKRRLTLSLCGLGILDETEIETSQPERIATIVDGQVTIDPETAKSLVDRPIETKKKGRPKKESVPDAGKPWAGTFEQKPVTIETTTVPGNQPPVLIVQKTDEPATNGQPNIHGVVIDDSEIPFPGDPEPTPEVQKTDRLATEAERKEFMGRLIKLKDKGFTGIREFLLKESGVQITNDIPFARMQELVARLEVAESEGKLRELLGGK